MIVSLEMFERDVQEPLEHFAMGHIVEEEFLEDARPWPRYRTDYKPLVDLAIDKEWPIVAANVPRPIASEVSKGGLDVLQSKTDAEKKLFARELEVPDRRRLLQAVRRAKWAGIDGYDGYDRQVRTRYGRAVLPRAVFEGRDDGRVGRQAYTASAAVAARGRWSCTSPARFTATSARGRSSGFAARLPGKRVVIVSMVPVEKLDVPAA